MTRHNTLTVSIRQSKANIPESVKMCVKEFMAADSKSLKPKDIRTVAVGVEFEKHVQDFLIPGLLRSEDILVEIDNGNTAATEGFCSRLEALHEGGRKEFLRKRVAEFLAVGDYL